jgi:hypothetical protein
MSFTLNINDEHEFFKPRLEEELEKINLSIQLKSKEDLIKAKKIYDKLILEFKYDTEINRLEDLLIDKAGIFPDYEKILSKEVFDVYILSINTDITYKDFMNNYAGLHKKIDYKLHNIKQKIMNSDDYKIKKLNLLKKELNKYNILS